MDLLHRLQKAGLAEREQVLRTLPVAYLSVFLFCLQQEVVPGPAERGLESLPVPPMAALLEGSVEQWEAAKLAPGFPKVCFLSPMWPWRRCFG